MALGDYEQIDPATGMLLPADVVPEADVGGAFSGMYTAQPGPGPAQLSMDEQLAGAEQVARSAEPPLGAEGFHPGTVAGPTPGEQLIDTGYNMGMPLIGTVKSKRPLYNETNQRITVGEQAGLQSTEAQREQLAEQDETARYVRDQEREHANKMQEFAIDEKARQFAEVERREQIALETEQAAKLEFEASQHLANTPPQDPGRWWHDASAGKRAGFVIGSIFYGLMGGDPLKIINTAIDRDIDAQKTDFARRQAVANERHQFTNTKRNIWADLRANALSDDEANLQAKNAYLEAFKQNVIAGLHERGVAELQPVHKQLLAQIEDQQAANTLRWQQLRAANTKYVFRKQNYAPGPDGKLVPISGAEAKYRRKMGEKFVDAGLKEEQSSRDATRNLQGTLTAQAHKAQLDAPRPGELNKDDRLDIRALRADDKYSAAVAMLGHVDRMLEIAGRHGGKAPDVVGPFEFGGDGPEDILEGKFAKVLRSEDKEAWDIEAGNAREVWVNRLTGAVASDEQQAVAAALTGEGAMSAGERVRALKRARQIVEDFIKQKESHITESARQELRRNPNLPSIPQSSVASEEDVEGLQYDE